MVTNFIWIPLFQGFRVVVERGLGVAAEFSDENFIAVGASVVSSSEAWGSDIVLRVRPPTIAEVSLLKVRHNVDLRPRLGMMMSHSDCDCPENVVARDGGQFQLGSLYPTGGPRTHEL